MIADTRQCAGLDAGREMCPRALVSKREVVQLCEGRVDNIHEIYKSCSLGAEPRLGFAPQKYPSNVTEIRTQTEIHGYIT